MRRSARWVIGRSRQLLDQSSEHDRIVMGLIMCREDERGATPPHEFDEPVKFELIVGSGEFGSVATAELVPSVRVVTEPSPEFVARRECAEPFVQVRLALGDPSRPEPIHQDAVTVVASRAVIDPSEPGACTHVGTAVQTAEVFVRDSLSAIMRGAVLRRLVERLRREPAPSPWVFACGGRVGVEPVQHATPGTRRCRAPRRRRGQRQSDR